MIKKISAAMLMMFVFIYGYTQDTNTKSKDKDTIEAIDKEPSGSDALGAHVYYENIIENFEVTNYTDKDIIYYKKKDTEWASIAIREEYPAPLKDSKKYLGIKLVGRRGVTLQIVPPKRLIINKYCQSISAWVYGKNMSGELSLLINDFSGNSHKIILGVLNYGGWRKLTVMIPRNVVQEDIYLNQKARMEILKILYKPFTDSPSPREHRFYIDDISAFMREKYVDRQRDDW